jgi:hypothetical protein
MTMATRFLRAGFTIFGSCTLKQHRAPLAGVAFGDCQNRQLIDAHRKMAVAATPNPARTA